MSVEPRHGNVLVFSDDPESGERLGRWIGVAGERPVVLNGAENYLIEESDDESVDLIVTDLDTEDPAARALLQRFLDGGAFAEVPQIHVFRDAALRDSLRDRSPDEMAISLAGPPEASEFQARVRLAAEVGRLRRELARSSIGDPMTGLFNRRYVVHRLDEEFSRARRYRSQVTLVVFDIDHLRRINEAYGQKAGDAVIRRVAQALRGRVRKEDVLGRTGEESFAVVLPGNRFRSGAVLASSVLNEISERPPTHEERPIETRVSAGISSYPDNSAVERPGQLLAAAENALLQAKIRGGNRVHIDEGVLRRARPVILVADPDRRLLELAEDLLSLDEYRVLAVDSSRTALATLRCRRPDLLVVDLAMRDDTDDAPLVESVQRMFPDDRFPVVGLSQDPEATPERLAGLGVDRFITKPFSAGVLRSVVREMLEDGPADG